jgi:hypothetical protein
VGMPQARMRTPRQPRLPRLERDKLVLVLARLDQATAPSTIARKVGVGYAMGVG